MGRGCLLFRLFSSSGTKRCTTGPCASSGRCAARRTEGRHKSGHTQQWPEQGGWLAGNCAAVLGASPGCCRRRLEWRECSTEWDRQRHTGADTCHQHSNATAIAIGDRFCSVIVINCFRCSFSCSHSTEDPYVHPCSFSFKEDSGLKTFISDKTQEMTI
jgi:hypothetical protein